jgi:hypothetical protein
MLEDLFEAFVQGASQGDSKPTTQKGAAAASPWMDMLESFMGGAAAPDSTGPSGGDLSSLGGIGSLLEAFMGGGQQTSIGANPLLAPLTEQLAEKLGISPQMASIIMSFAFSLLVSRLQESAQSGTIQKSKDGGFDLDDLLDDDYLDSQGITTQLADQTGLEEDEAKQSLKEAVTLLSGQVSSAEQPAPPSSSGSELESLLDSWED